MAATTSMHNLEYEPVELRECINSMILLVDQDYDAVILLEKMLKLLENFGMFNTLSVDIVCAYIDSILHTREYTIYGAYMCM